MTQLSAGRAADEVERVLRESEEDHVADHVALGRAGNEVLRLARHEAVEAVDGEPGEKRERVGACHGQLGHVERLVEEDARVLPGELLVPPVRELGRDSRIDVRPGLGVAQQLDGVVRRREHVFQASRHHVSFVVRGHRGSRLSMPPGRSPWRRAWATLKRWVRMAFSACVGIAGDDGLDDRRVLGHRRRRSGRE